MSTPAKHTTFTPGPHTVVAADHLGSPAYAIRAADGDLIAVGLLRGDANLFANAPRMFEALQTIKASLVANELMWISGAPAPVSIVEFIEAALATPVLEREG